eukprot:TRINITY_DN90589_c0_g1_i1.p1 TRINITY_DN90589_c0_g1~~TRINITY_DN90589_c0_g1_i1.p1  ORF type:complete len:543 (-),score=56.02 TRINITY_DN90589_c0_g1_i1:442-2070(-)
MEQSDPPLSTDDLRRSKSELEPAKGSDFSKSEKIPPASLPMNSIVRLFVTSAKRSYTQPWVVNKEQQSTGSGFIVDGRLILTNAHVIEDATMVEVKKQQQAQKYQAKVVCIGHDVDLALVMVEDESFWHHPEPLRPISWGSGEAYPDLYSEVRVVGFPSGGSTICVTKGVISRVDAQLYVHPKLKGIFQHTHGCHGNLPIIQIDAAINPGNSGGPAFDEFCNVVGIASSGMPGAQNVGYIIPNQIAFLLIDEYAKSNAWSGVSEFGVMPKVLESSAMRRYLKMGDKTGVLIESVAPLGALAGTIFAKDILTAIDGSQLTHEGKVSCRISGQDVEMFADVLISRKPKGSITTLTLLRDGEESNIEVMFTPIPPLSPRYDRYDSSPTYVILGGLVFTKHSHALMKEYLKADPKERTIIISGEIMNAGLDQWKEDENHEVVLLLRTLRHPVNAGYGGRSVKMLKRFNGNPVETLAGLANAAAAALDGPDGPACEFLRFGFQDDQPEDFDSVVLVASEVRAADAEICKTHRIPRSALLEDDGPVFK